MNDELSPYYKKDFSCLEMYQKLIQYWTIIFNRREKLYVLDNMNFSKKIFPEIITLAEIQAFHEIEPGYISPDGFIEAHLMIRQIEKARLLRNSPHSLETIERLVNGAGVGCGNGCSNVMNALIHTILKWVKQNGGWKGKAEQPEIMLVLPNYTVYTAQVTNLKYAANYKYIYTQRKNNFLPTFDEVAERASDKTVAVIITYPNNPCQATYEGEQIEELRKILSFCRENEIFLIVDNIYQDLLFPAKRCFAEIFGLTESLDYVIKVYGSSKDTPFFSGYRTGYWFGDPRLMEAYKFYISSTENSLNVISLSLFLMNLYFKSLVLENREPVLADMELFSYGVFGWSEEVVLEQLYSNLREMDLFSKYKQRIALSNRIQENAIKEAKGFASASKAFGDYLNQDIGNVFFLKVNPDLFRGSDHEFFKFLYYRAQCGALPGSVFGMPDTNGDVWIRITLLHDRSENIIRALSVVEEALLKEASVLTM